ncbi:hypothetical protein QJS66_07270 [Kocuria rhizophila]|nr:hypothetical protein QJS66_07270 [Kocuria rhizophila]
MMARKKARAETPADLPWRVVLCGTSGRSRGPHGGRHRCPAALPPRARPDGRISLMPLEHAGRRLPRRRGPGGRGPGLGHRARGVRIPTATHLVVALREHHTPGAPIPPHGPGAWVAGRRTTERARGRWCRRPPDTDAAVGGPDCWPDPCVRPGPQQHRRALRGKYENPAARVPTRPS